MRIIKRISALAAGLSAATIMATVPVSAQATNTAATLKGVGDKHNVVALDTSNNAVASVSTEMDCTMHSMKATVTNNSSAAITPTVTFNDRAPGVPPSFSINPGESGSYFYQFSGNHMLITTKVSIDGQDPIILTPTVNCQEPISFRVDKTSASAVTGYITNNSSLVSQTVLTRVNSGDIHVESLAPGETRLIALPFTANEGQMYAFIEVGTTAGYEGMYSVDLTQPNPPVAPM